MNINLMYEQTMKSERQNNEKIKKMKKRTPELADESKKEKYAQRIFKSVTTESFDFEILRESFAFFLAAALFSWNCWVGRRLK